MERASVVRPSPRSPTISTGRLVPARPHDLFQSMVRIASDWPATPARRAAWAISLLSA